MQQIERYGVIALVFLLVTIVAVSFWGDSKSPGFWSRLTGKSDGKKEQVVAQAAGPATLVADHVTDPNAPLSPTPQPTPIVAAPMSGPAANQPTPTDMPAAGNATTPVAPPVVAALPPVQPTPAQTAPIQPNVAPPAATATEYVVQSGDSLAKIAAKTLGNANRWKEIQAANGNIDPKSLTPGHKLKIPAGGTVAAATKTAATPTAKVASNNTPKVGTSLVNALPPKSATKVAPMTAEAKKSDAKSAPKEASAKTASTYTVKQGDLIRKIAEAQLGSADRWKDIVAANPGIDANKLFVGQKLKLPGAPRAAESTKPVVAAAGKPRVR